MGTASLKKFADDWSWKREQEAEAESTMENTEHHEIFRDTRLLPSEDPNLKRDILNTLGEEWLNAKNVWLRNHTPNELIGTRQEFQVRDLLRSIKGAALS